jgi:hypothetical protein
MKLYFYRAHHANFGDELNLWLMPKVFPDFFDEDPSVLFLAIGSIILDTHPKDALKVVFGSGYAGYSDVPKIDDKWKFYCVRGSKTAEACGLSTDLVAGDTAILIHRHLPLNRHAKVHKFSYMPHWQSVDVGHWQRVCRWSGVHFIDPRRPVDEVLDELQKTEVLVTEAMHGAIVADALRVPWIPVQPAVTMHRQKWLDWASALDLKLDPVVLGPSSTYEAKASSPLTGGLGALARAGMPGRKLASLALATRAATALQRATRMPPNLSSDAALERALQKLESAADRVRRDFA